MFELRKFRTAPGAIQTRGTAGEIGTMRGAELAQSRFASRITPGSVVASDAEVFYGEITNDTVDRYQSIVHTDGIVLDNFERNPVIYADHGWMMDRLPIGRSVAIVREAHRMEGAFMLAAGDDLAEQVRNLLHQRVLRALSISWIPLQTDVEWREVHDEEGNTTSDPILHYRKIEMLEYSVVGLPGNAGALIPADGAGDTGGGRVLRYATATDEARAMVARVVELLVKGKATQADLQRACERVLQVYDTTPDKLRACEMAFDCVSQQLDLINALPIESEERSVLALALAACMEDAAE